jgi:serine/threonine-protein phosphatase PGAM5
MMHFTTEKFKNDGSMTGGAFDFERATTSLSNQSLSSSKKVTLVRHGLSSWNQESKVQVCSSSAFLKSLSIFYYVSALSYNHVRMEKTKNLSNAH